MAEVNLDVAMQSTSEEILEKVGSVGRRGEIYTYAKSASGGTVDIFSVTGKGKLYYCLGNNYVAKGDGSISLVIDGNVVYSESSNSATSSNAHQFLLGNKDYCIGYDSNQIQYYFNGYPIGKNMSAPEPVALHTIDENSRVNITGLSASGQYPRPVNIDGYIQFNESVQVKFTGCYSGSGHTCYVCYSLDEE